MTQTPQSDRPDWATDILNQIANLKLELERSNERLETYQKASDRVANLAFSVVTSAAAVVVLAPVVKVAAEFAATYLPK